MSNYVEKDSITINKKLVLEENEKEFVTKVPYEKEYVKYPKELAQWVSDKTLKVHVEDSRTFAHSHDPAFKTSDMRTGKALKIHYDEVIRKNLQLQQQQREANANYINSAMPELEHKELTPEDKARAHQEAMKFGEFEHSIYKDENVMKFYPQQLRADTEFQKLTEYRNQQDIFLKDYLQRNEMEKAVECQERIDAADALIADKTDSYVKELQDNLKPEMNDLSTHSPVSLDAESFKSYPADLQRDDEFKKTVLYKAQLEDYRDNLVNAINTNTQTFEQAIKQGASPDALLKFENTIQEHESTYVQKIAALTDKINGLDFSINYQVSRMQSIKPVEIPTIGEKMNSLGIKTVDQIKHPMHHREHLLSVGKQIGNVGIYQTRDGQNFIGRANSRGIQQIGRSGNLKDIAKNFKSYAASCKQEMKLQQQRHLPKPEISFGGRGR